MESKIYTDSSIVSISSIFRFLFRGSEFDYTFSLSTLIFITEKKKIFRDKIGCQRQPEAIKSEKLAILMVRYDKNIIFCSYHGAHILITC